jgi:FtsP/CotA-like multicopper oxidase with cupredoxin domain
MESAGFDSNPIRYGDDEVFSSNSQFPNASQSNGNQNTLVYGYAIKAYGKSYPAQFPPPILQVNQGQKIDIDLIDHLQTHNGMPSGSLYENNFHGHGLHVSPLSMGDNVYPIINDPGTPTEPEFMRVRIPIPKNQESGFQWFHPHKHEQTHQQVYGGLAGMLVTGDVLDPWPKYKAGGSQPLKQRYIGLSEVNIQRTNAAGTEIDPNGPNRLLVYATANAPNPQGGKTNCFGNAKGSVPQCSWQKRVNGQLNPVITMRPGATEVWNVISMGAFGSFNLAITDSQLQNPWNATILAFDGDESDNGKTLGLDIKPLPLTLSADDNRMNDLLAATLLMPGNRVSMAVTAPKKPGTYYLIDGWGGCNSPAAGVTATGQNPGKSSCAPVTYPAGQSYPITYFVLATIVVEGPEYTKPAPVFDVKGSNYWLFSAPVTQKREFSFYVDAVGTYANNPSLKLQTPLYPLDTCPGPSACFDINGKTFGHGPLTTIQIGSIEEWTLINEKQVILNASDGSYNSSNSASHPFHIHQGNFIVTEVDGKPVNPNVTSPQSSLNYVSARDEANIPQPLPYNGPNPLTASIKIKFRVEDYPGKYVFHCHILKHEDQGMMVPVLAVGPVDGLRGAFGSSLGEAGVVNVVDGTGAKTSTKYPFGYGFTGGTTTASALGAAKYFNNYAVAKASGGSDVAIYGGKDQKLLHRFDAFPDIKAPNKGVSVALGDINGDGDPEVIVGSRSSGTAKLRIYSPSGVLMQKFDGFLGGNYPNGINVAAGDVNGDNFDDIIVGAGAGQAPVVTIYSGRQLTYHQGLQTVVQFTATGDSQSGVRVATGYVAPATVPSYIGNVVTSPETGTGSGTVQVWNTSASQPLQPMVSYSPFPGSNLPVQLQTGYVGIPGVAQVFAWTTPNRVASTSFNSTSVATTTYLDLTQ